ncbi:MAG: hypothetical protein HY905_04050 [Deltaproteobacteria bacterium]|nr:hypothetical protein [Deltaproteobacteria bacterium]
MEKRSYYVLVREVHVAVHEVEAETEAEAKALVRAGESRFQRLEYSHTLDASTWTVEEKTGGS